MKEETLRALTVIVVISIALFMFAIALHYFLLS